MIQKLAVAICTEQGGRPYDESKFQAHELVWHEYINEAEAVADVIQSVTLKQMLQLRVKGGRKKT